MVKKREEVSWSFVATRKMRFVFEWWYISRRNVRRESVRRPCCHLSVWLSKAFVAPVRFELLSVREFGTAIWHFRLAACSCCVLCRPCLSLSSLLCLYCLSIYHEAPIIQFDTNVGSRIPRMGCGKSHYPSRADFGLRHALVQSADSSLQDKTDLQGNHVSIILQRQVMDETSRSTDVFRERSHGSRRHGRTKDGLLCSTWRVHLE